ncbi:MAG: class I SAM-dependent methyltransferase, partial [Gammaproteobacteria bacterium]|nr:class I SAM-dependent methyltransferase [Gammaproteobacteria bacterium]
MNSFTYMKYRSRNPFQQLLIRRFFERCASLISKLEINSVLEVGCGEGFFLEQLHNRFPHLGLKGSDIDQLAIEYGMQRFPQFKFQTEVSPKLKHNYHATMRSSVSMKYFFK